MSKVESLTITKYKLTVEVGSLGTMTASAQPRADELGFEVQLGAPPNGLAMEELPHIRSRLGNMLAGSPAHGKPPTLKITDYRLTVAVTALGTVTAMARLVTDDGKFHVEFQPFPDELNSVEFDRLRRAIDTRLKRLHSA